MSDILDFIELLRYKNNLTTDSNHSLNYVRQQCVSAEEIFMTVHVRYDCLRHWYKALKEVQRCGLKSSYIEILNIFLREKNFPLIREDSGRIEGRLRRVCGEVNTKYLAKNGTFCHNKLNDTVFHLSVRADEVLTLSQVQRDLEAEKARNEELSKENESLQTRCEALYNNIIEASILQNMTDEHLSDVVKQNQSLMDENEQLHSYLDRLGQHLDFENNSSREFSQVGKRQQHRKLIELKTNIEKALWFTRTFGLDLQNLNFTDNSGEQHTISWGPQQKKSYEHLTEDDQKKIKSVLFILDKFCIGDAAYHELTATPGGEHLPRSYLIKQCKDELNQLCHITRTPGPALGAQVDFHTELESVIKKQISQKKMDVNDPNLKLHIKISGDGAKMSKITNFVVISFSVLNSKEDVMSSKGNHTLAVIKGQESYDLLKTSCDDIFKQINESSRNGKISINGKEIPLEFYLGGDFKFLLLILGMKSATSDYACIWCTIHKNDRFDVTKPQNHYWGDSIVRTIDDLKKYSKTKKYSCDHQPLLEIPLSHVVLDELHLMLRITDKLLKNLVMDAIEWDKKDNIDKPPSQHTTKHLKQLTKTICSCGISFDVWEKTNADGKGSGVYDFTSLMGSDKKLILRTLPQKLNGVIRPSTSDTIIKIWKDFDALYTSMLTNNPTEEQVDDYFKKACDWITLLYSIGGISQGYSKARVTPYMHAMVYHTPRFMKLHNGIKKFTGQGVEKLNDDCRRVHLQRSNKWDAPTDILLAGKRLEHLVEYERTPRVYKKKNTDYWETSIRDTREKRQRICTPLEPEDTYDDIVENMTAEEIKSKLKDMGITTRLRSLTKLQDLLRTHIKSSAELSTN